MSFGMIFILSDKTGIYINPGTPKVLHLILNQMNPNNPEITARRNNLRTFNRFTWTKLQYSMHYLERDTWSSDQETKKMIFFLLITKKCLPFRPTNTCCKMTSNNNEVAVHELQILIIFLSQLILCIKLGTQLWISVKSTSFSQDSTRRS